MHYLYLLRFVTLLFVKRNLKFQNQWLEKWNWLAYSTENTKVIRTKVLVFSEESKIFLDSPLPNKILDMCLCRYDVYNF